MLAPEHRLRSSALFSTVVKKGARKGSRTLVVHLWTPEPGPDAPLELTGGPRAGLIVSKAVGNAVNETVVYAFMSLFVVNVVVTAIGIRMSAK